jgi:hypothetical protein
MTTKTTPELNVVQFPLPVPLTDVPGMLRQLADALEHGEYGELATCFCVMPVPGSVPLIFGYGLEGGNLAYLNLTLDLAKQDLLLGLVEDGDDE